MLLSGIHKSKYSSNLTKTQRQALKNLRQDKTIVIKSADKGSCVTIIPTTQYQTEGIQHLSQNAIYKEIDRDYTKLLIIKINNFLRTCHRNKIISDELYQVMRRDPDSVRTQLIYFLRKVHKTPQELRPIVSGVNGPTETISAFVDDTLRPYLRECKHLINNSTEIINIIETTYFPPHTLLISLDVKSVYLRIPQDEGITRVMSRIYNHQRPPNIPREHLEHMIKRIIKDNIFAFGERYWKQTLGIAMGTRCAPTFANLYMASLEEEFLARRTRHNHPIPHLWLRYIDDILAIWTFPFQPPDDFLDEIDSYHYSITFTHEVSSKQINFLDLTIFKGHRFSEQGFLDLRPYAKACHSFSYLHFTSNHHPGVFKGIFIGEVKRTMRNSSNINIFAEELNKLVTRLRSRGYPFWKLMKWLKDILYNQRQSLLTGSSRLRCITPIFHILITQESRKPA